MFLLFQKRQNERIIRGNKDGICHLWAQITRLISMHDCCTSYKITSVQLHWFIVIYFSWIFQYSKVYLNSVKLVFTNTSWATYKSPFNFRGCHLRKTHFNNRNAQKSKREASGDFTGLSSNGRHILFIFVIFYAKSVAVDVCLETFTYKTHFHLCRLENYLQKWFLAILHVIKIIYISFISYFYVI